ncbi:MAG: DUF1648 domain-containing protein [Desulfitobacteriaceae bacterium]|nr:DUF1648 domain-containing protein [Desulfitobacteriaceae bacterium]
MAVLFLIVMVVRYWPTLPNTLPTHFGGTGIPDEWGGKSFALILPVVSFVLYIILTVCGRFPHTFNYICPITEENVFIQYAMARTMLSALKLEMIVMFTYIEWVTFQVALGQSEGLGDWFLPVTLGVIFGSIGIYILFSLKYRK